MGHRRHNLFLALQPDAKAVAAVGRIMDRLRPARGFSLREIRPDCLHISLVSLGEHADVPLGLIDTVKTAVSTVTMPPFVVALNRVVGWKGRAGQRPLVLEGDEGVAGVHMLLAQIHSGFVGAGLEPRRFDRAIPDLTLAYGDPDLPEEIVPPLCWTVREFVLVDSLVGEGRHVVLHRWPLITIGTTLSAAPSNT